jgi:CHAT domain-containing protein
MSFRKARKHNIDAIYFFISLVFILYTLPVFSIPYLSFNDSIIDAAIRNANYESALALIHQYRQQHAFDSKDNAFLLLKSGEIFLHQGNTVAAEKVIAEAGIILSTIANPGHKLQFQYAIQQGRYLNFTGKYAGALTWLHQAEYHVEHLINDDPFDVAGLYSELGSNYNQLGKYKTAIRYYELAADMHKGESSFDKIRTNYYNTCLAFLYRKCNEPERAAELIHSCFDFFNKVTEPLNPGLLLTYLNLAEYSISVNGDIPETERVLRNATLILDKYYPADHFIYGTLYSIKSELEYSKNDFENALFYNTNALIITCKYSALLPYRIDNYFMIARICYWQKNDYRKAIYYCNLALSNISVTNQSPAYYYYLIGCSYNKLKDEQNAECFFNQVIQVTSASRSFTDLNILSRAYYDLAMIARNKNKTNEAHYYLQEALKASKDIFTTSMFITTIYYEIGWTYYLTNINRKALHAIQQSIISGCRTFSDTSIFANPSITDIQITYRLIESFSFKAYLLYEIHEDNNDLNYLKMALDCQELAVKLTDRLVMEIDEENSGLDLINRKKKALDNAVSYATLLYRHTDNRQYAEKAFGYAEKSKMQLLFIKTQRRNLLQQAGVPDSLIYKEEKLNHKILAIENQFALTEKSGDLTNLNENLLEKLTWLYGQRDEFANRLGKEYPAYQKVKYDVKLAGIESIQQMLEDDQVILEYQLLDTEIITFVISRNDFSIQYQLIDNQVPVKIQQLRDVLASDPLQSEQDSAFESFINSSFYLYEKLIGPVYDKIRNKRLIIVPHNHLTKIPFEVLIAEKPKPHQRPDYKSLNYLIKEFPIAYAYSANLLLDQDQGRKFGSGTAIFLPDYNSYKGKKESQLFPELKGAANEANIIKRISHGKLFSFRLGDELTFKKKAAKYRVLHIASHTLLDEKNPSLSYIAMTAPADTIEDGCLYSYEITQMKLNAQLVVLSGCNTGYGIMRKNEGLISIARSFFYTGVRTVTYTLWPVADGTGALIISEFYKELRHRHRLDDALRNSKLKFLEEADPVKAHPFYWAGYVVVGKTDSVTLQKYNPLLKGGLASLILILLSACLYKKLKT